MVAALAKRQLFPAHRRQRLCAHIVRRVAIVGDEQREQLLATVCPNILFPYAREAVDNLVVKGSFPALMLSPINFDALYAQQKQAQAEQAASTEPAN